MKAYRWNVPKAGGQNLSRTLWSVAIPLGLAMFFTVWFAILSVWIKL